MKTVRVSYLKDTEKLLVTFQIHKDASFSVILQIAIKEMKRLHGIELTEHDPIGIEIIPEVTNEN